MGHLWLHIRCCWRQNIFVTCVIVIMHAVAIVDTWLLKHSPHGDICGPHHLMRDLYLVIIVVVGVLLRHLFVVANHR